MKNKSDILAEQLKQTCKITGSAWASWLHWTGSDWDFCVQVSVRTGLHQDLMHYLERPEVAAWLTGALSSGRTRSRSLGETCAQMGCKRLYAFGNPKQSSLILVGSDRLVSEAQAYFRILALNNPVQNAPSNRPSDAPSLVSQNLPILLETGPDVIYDPKIILDWVLDTVCGQAACKTAFIAVRSGDVFRVEAAKGYKTSVLGQEIQIQEEAGLSQMVSQRGGELVEMLVEPPPMLLAPALPRAPGSYLARTVVIGRRVIGLVVLVFYRSQGISPSDAKLVEQTLDRVAHAVENAIVFKEISRFLQQFALLSELASAASIGTDTNQVAIRVINRLKRAFGTELVGVLLIGSDGHTLRPYGDELEENQAHSQMGSSLVDFVTETGMPFRSGDIRQSPRFWEGKQEIRSVLDVPLKYQGKVIGVIVVESKDCNAFTLQDEQLLIVIASQLAGLFENMRLSEERRERARNLDLIHQVVKQIVGLTDWNEIAQKTAELVSAYFNYEFVIILISDEDHQELVNLGVGGRLANRLKRGFRIPIGQGIAGRVLRSGQGFFSNQVETDPDYKEINGWQAGSELCVPLKDGEQVFGLINLERSSPFTFSTQDLQIIESLAGILSSVMINARQYQRLHDTVGQLQAAWATALDISGNLDLETLFQRVVHRARELTHSHGAALGLVDLEHRLVRISVTENMWEGDRILEIPLMQGVAGRVAGLGKTYNLVDYNLAMGRTGPENQMPFSAIVGVPLKWKDDVMGVLIVIDDQPGRVFGGEEVRLLELLAPQVAVCIRNARLYKELEERMAAQKLAERKLIHAARLAALGELAAGVAHELNNPLTTVTGFVELALDELPNDLTQRAELQIVLDEARRARGVVRRLLDFSRQSDHSRQSTDLNDLVRDVLALVQHQAQAAQVQIKFSAIGELIRVNVDPNQIKQVLLNLVQNGLQAMPNGGLLTLVTSLEHEVGPGGTDWALVRVSDTGNGIQPEYLEKIFEPFFTTRQVGDGTGLGLSVSYGIITDHGGRIEVESQPGAGSCFTVWLPAHFEGQNA